MDKETMRQVVIEALRPIVGELAVVGKRLEAVEARAAEMRRDVFGDTVRGRDIADVEQAAREKARDRDPVGAAIREERAPLISRHPSLDRLNRRRGR